MWIFFSTHSQLPRGHLLLEVPQALRFPWASRPSYVSARAPGRKLALRSSPTHLPTSPLTPSGAIGSYGYFLFCALLLLPGYILKCLSSLFLSLNFS